MISFFPRESWKQLDYVSRSGFKYAISNYGRFVSFTESIKDGLLLKCCQVKGYRVFRYSIIEDGKRIPKNLYLHKLVAEFFLPQKRDDQTFVIHLNYVKDNNHVDNLKWANQKEKEEHQNNNPVVIKDRKRLANHNRMKEYKLTEERVRILKRKLFDPNRKTRLKMLARQFGVSEMQLHRIKTGENWGHVKI